MALGSLNILFVHQNFPGQYAHIVRSLCQEGCHNIIALGINDNKSRLPSGLKYYRYSITKGTTDGIHALASEIETKIIYGEACARAAHKLKLEGFTPDIICCHPGWGVLFLRDVWPNIPILAYQEFYYSSYASDTTFDPEFCATQTWAETARVRMKNTHLDLSLKSATWNITPTFFQRNKFPLSDQARMSVIHDGVNTDIASPASSENKFNLPDGTEISKSDHVVTFVNRTIEPYRGCHTFIRSIPHIQSRYPNSQIVIVGSTSGTSYGSPCPGGEWKDVFLDEIRSSYDPTRVHFTGNLPYASFISLLQISSCHVYLTYPFVLSWSLLEAMSCACPIVASSTEPVQEVITDGVNGLLVNFFSPEALATAVTDLLSNASLSHKLGRAARQKILSEYSLSKCLPRHLQLINLVASRAIGS